MEICNQYIGLYRKRISNIKEIRSEREVLTEEMLDEFKKESSKVVSVLPQYIVWKYTQKNSSNDRKELVTTTQWVL